MFPILYSSVTEGTVPSNNGLGILSDAIDCQIVEERNGIYELTCKYPASGIHASELTERRILKAKPNFTDDPQLFRIYKIGKVLGGAFTVYARHISYDLSGKVIKSGTASSCTGAMALLEAQAGAYTLTTDKTVSASFKITEPSSVRSWFAGKKGSILDVFGTGEYHYDNYEVSYLAHRGTDRGVKILYGKNLLSLSQNRDSSNIITAVIAFWKDSQSGSVVIGNSISTGVSLDVPNVKTLDCSDAFDTAPTTAQLDAKATAYIGANNVATPTNSITLNFLQIGTLKDRVDLCDTVHIEYEDFGITATAKCIKTVWDVIKEKYISIEIGEPKTNITDTIISNAKETASKPSTTAMAQAINTATSLITGNLGGYLIIHDSNDDGYPDELLIMNTADISTATKVWRFNVAGLGYSNTGYSGNYGLALTMDGEIVADKITTGTLRSIMIESDNYVVGTSGTKINLTDGTIKSKNFNVSSNGIATANMFTAETQLNVFGAVGNNATNIMAVWANTDSSNNIMPYFSLASKVNGTFDEVCTIRSGSDDIGILNLYGATSGSIHIPHTYLRGNGTISLRNSAYPNAIKERIFLDGNNGQISLKSADGTNTGVSLDGGTGELMLRNTSGQYTVWLRSKTGYNNGGGVDFYNTSGTAVAYIGCNNTSGGAGQLNLSDSSGTANIQANGSSGDMWVVHLYQTSSKKIKKNITELSLQEAQKVLDLKPVTFDFKNEALGTDRRGFIAEDVEEIIPQIVTEVNDLKSIDYVSLIPYLVKIIQEQDKRIKDLEDK